MLNRFVNHQNSQLIAENQKSIFEPSNCRVLGFTVSTLVGNPVQCSLTSETTGIGTSGEGMEWTVS